MSTTLPTLAWTRQFGSAEFDHAEDMTVDRFGNVYLAGHSRGQIGDTDAEDEDSWIAKMDAYGNLIWIEQFGSEGIDFVHGITTDHFGFLYVSGHTTGEKVADGHQGGSDAWLAKYDPDGQRLWLQQIGTASDDAGHGIAVDAQGHVYVAGYTHGDLEASGSTDTDADAWLAKFDNAGTRLFLKHIGSRADDVAYDVAVDAFGNVYVGGYTRGRISSNSEDRGSKQIWVMKLDGKGNQVWIREFGAGNKDDEIRSMATDNQGNLFVTGMTYLERPQQNQLKRNVFVTKIRANSSIQWSRFLGTEETDIAYGIATDPMGNIFVTGYTKGELVDDQAKGGDDVFVAKFNTEGEELWVEQLGTSVEDRGEAIAIDAFGNIYLSGYTQGRKDQGQNFGTGQDAWVSKYLGNPTEEEQFHLLSDYMQQMNGRVSRIEVSTTDTHHVSGPGLLQLADQLIAGDGDGRISREDAQQLVSTATDENGAISQQHKMELAYIFFAYELTVAARDEIEGAVRS